MDLTTVNGYDVETIGIYYFIYNISSLIQV